MNNDASFVLEIEELILHGVAPGDRYRVSVAIEQELTRLFTERGIPPSLLERGVIASLDAGEIGGKAGVKPEKMGIQVAQSIYGGLGQ